jgi:pimeloyl-ACP methyl ester carboxylesterase
MDRPLNEVLCPSAGPRAIPPGRDEWLTLDRVRYCFRVFPQASCAFEPTLFLSGAFQTMDSWARFARAFAPHTTVVLIDPPGMGRAEPLASDVGLDFLADAVAGVIDHLALDRINLVAASYGTPAAFRLAQRYPERVARIALAGTMKEIPAHVREPVRATTRSAIAGERELLAKQVIDGLLCHDATVAIARRALAERVLRGGLTRMSDAELRQYAANTTRLLEHPSLDLSVRIRGPRALVFTGEHDCFTVPDACLEVAMAFEHALFTTVREADHLFHIEQFDAVCALLLAFMGDETARGVPGCTPVVEATRARRARVSAWWISSTAKDGGESGIRTRGRVSPTHAFQACSFNHSDISPCLWIQRFTGERSSPKPGS